MWCIRWLGLLALAAPACGSSGGAPVTPTTPVADVCGMLTLSTVQTLLPGAPAGAPLTLADDPDIWIRGCAWQANGMSVSLIVEGPLTSNGNLVFGIQVTPTSTGTAQVTAVSGVGDKAVYIINPALDRILRTPARGATSSAWSPRVSRRRSPRRHCSRWSSRRWRSSDRGR